MNKRICKKKSNMYANVMQKAYIKIYGDPLAGLKRKKAICKFRSKSFLNQFQKEFTRSVFK